MEMGLGREKMPQLERPRTTPPFLRTRDPTVWAILWIWVSYRLRELCIVDGGRYISTLGLIGSIRLNVLLHLDEVARTDLFREDESVNGLGRVFNWWLTIAISS
jgi:hypothetical protein